MANVERTPAGSIGGKAALSQVTKAASPQNFQLIGNARIYGNPLGTVDPKEVSSLKSSPTTELHLLRHFSQLPTGYTLIDQDKEVFNSKDKTTTVEPITNDDLQKAITTKGSKFFIGVSGLSTPADVVNFVRSEATRRAGAGELSWYDGGFCKKTSFVVELPGQIGTDGVVSLSELSPEQQSKVTEQNRGKLAGDDFKVKLVNHPGVTTNKLSVVIGHIKGEESPGIFMSYPGELAPPFPGDYQGEEERNYNKQFWNEHVFIA